VAEAKTKYADRRINEVNTILTRIEGLQIEIQKK
jgi:hypothetical protein